MARYFWRAWPLCGALDLGYAILITMVMGGTAKAVLLSVASGPFGDGVADWGALALLLGVLVHFAIMAMMVAAYAPLSRTQIVLRMGPWLAGILWGLALYLVMYWIILPLRFPAVHPITEPARIARALFPHLALVGIPMALIARQTLSGARS